MPQPTRRELFRVLAGGSAALLADPVLALQEPSRAVFWPGYPRQDQKIVGEVVGAAHFDERRVRELIGAYPELVNACWDWGFGDWESPLGAAAHVGDRGIAEFLLERGARIDVFAAAMLGQTEVVKAFVSAKPGIQRTLGPHNISLLAHAEAGGEQAKETLEFLMSLGDADAAPKTEPLTEESKQAVLGEYASQSHDLKMVCKLNRNGQLVADFQTSQSQSNGRLLRYKGNAVYFPAGVPSVTVQFTMKDGAASVATVAGSVPTVALARV